MIRTGDVVISTKEVPTLKLMTVEWVREVRAKCIWFDRRTPLLFSTVLPLRYLKKARASR